MKKILLVVVCFLSIALFSTSCKKQCTCTIYDEKFTINEEDLEGFVNDYVNVSQYGVELKHCTDVDEMYRMASENGITIQKVITCK